MKFASQFVVLAIASLLAGCNNDDLAQMAADGKATGGACRHAGRALEDCFALNTDAPRAAVFDGWKEMNDYMRENKIAEVVPQHKSHSAETEAPPETAPHEGDAEETAAVAPEHADAAHASDHGATDSAEEKVASTHDTHSSDSAKEN
jgi:hypothetical protein